MKKIYKKIFFVSLVLTVLMVCFAFSSSAAKEDYYTYFVENGEATITYVDTSISGDVTVPSTLGGYRVTSIGVSAFGLCKNLTSIIIPDGVTSIGSSVFNNCTALTSITIPDSVTEIGSYTFNGCTSLSSVTIAGDISTIGSSAFKGCKRLASVKIPDSVTEIGESAFENCTYLTNITIPDSVTSIGPYAFSNCTSIANITIPDAVTSIGSYTFAGCTSLKSIIIPEDVISIGSYVFTDCIALTSIRIPDAVTSIGPYTFSGCIALTSITIPDGITLIDSYLFNNCTALTSITIPDSVTSIGDSAFSGCTSLRSFTIPNGVIAIGSYAFYECKSLTSITIPDSVTSMSYSVFRSCTALTDVTIGNGVTSIGDSTFRGCTGLTSIIIPESVTSIGSYAFYNTGYYNKSTNWENGVLYIGDHLVGAVDSITSYNINQGTKTIACSAFENCKALASITIPDSVISIGSYAFGNCTALKSITIPESVTRIGDYAFKDCTSFTSITIPDTVTSIGDGVFQRCTNLESIEIPYGVTSIGEYAFHSCTSLKSATIPSAVTAIGNFAFYACERLESIEIPYGVTSIGEYAFHSCTSLKSVTIPSAVTVIGNFTFYACERLENIDIPENVTSIGRFAFYNCSIPESIKIPDSVISIGDSAFLMCTNLKEVLYEGTMEQWNAITLGSSNTELTNSNVYYEHYNSHIIGDWLSADNGTHIKHCQNTYPCSYTETENCTFGEWSTTGEPTCDKEGAKQRVCDVCGYIQTQSIAVIAHTPGNVVTENIVEPKCEVMGSYDEVVYCLVCNAEVSRVTKEIEKTQHIFEATTTKATLTQNGKTETKCTACKYVSKATTIYYPKTIKLSSSEVTYNGAVRSPSVTVKDSKGKTLKNGTDYTVTTPSGRKTPGKYTYTIKFKGNYEGKKELTFTILPKAPNVKDISATQSESVINLKWKASEGATGYRVYQYSLSKKAYVQIASVKTTSYRKATNLKAGTEYKFKVKPYTKLSDGTVLWGTASDTFTTATECKAPKITSVTSPSKSKATVKWSNVSGETGYQLYYSTKKDSGFKKIDSYSANKLTGSKTFSASASGKTIYFKVRAYKKVNGQTIFGEWSAVKSVKLK